MRVLIKQGYTDSMLGRVVRKGEEISVSEEWAKRLVESGVATILGQDMGDLTNRIAELEAMLAEKDKLLVEKDNRIAELEAMVKTKK